MPDGEQGTDAGVQAQAWNSLSRPGSAPVLGIGELLFDLFRDGPRLGGAPFNVTANLRRLGHPAKFASAVGRDELGRRGIEAAIALGVEVDLISEVAGLPTGTVRVQLDASGSPDFAIASPAAYESIELNDEHVSRIADWSPGAIVFGTLAQRFPTVLESTRRVIAVVPGAVCLYDVNLREGCWSPELVRELLSLASVVKLNDAEARTLASAFGVGAGAGKLEERLAADHGVVAVCTTRGGRGAALWHDGRVHEVDGVPVEVVDAVGAGDAFAAGLLHGLLAGQGPVAALELANRLGALVASRPGALPAWEPREVQPS